jgi:benzoyl-CoA reductase subunit A
VVLDDDERRILGRGITNSRSNYDVACEVALGEALINARFSLIEALTTASTRARRARLHAFELAFRAQQYRAARRPCGRACRRPRDDRSKWARRVRGLEHLERMARRRASSSRRRARKSDFFRDLAGSRYVELAETAAKAQRTPFDPWSASSTRRSSRSRTRPKPSARSRRCSRTRARRACTGRPEERCSGRGDESAVDRARAARQRRHRLRPPAPAVPREAHPLRDPLPRPRRARDVPGTRTVLDIGGQDTKAIQVDEQGIVTSFQMNDRCAAGCGRYLGYIADEMNLGLHELGPLAGKACARCASTRPARCSPGAELRERLSLGEKREDILAGLHRAIILRAMSLLARSGGVRGRVHLHRRRAAMREHLTLGIDVGSAAVKAAVVRSRAGDDATVLGTSIQRIRRRELREVIEAAIAEATGGRITNEDFDYVATTGEADAVEFRTGHFYTITAHARGALHFDREAAGALDVGSLHARAIRLDPRGKVTGQRMTSQCASGSGQFLENIARYLGVPIEDVGELSRSARTPEVSAGQALLPPARPLNRTLRACQSKRPGSGASPSGARVV